MGISKTIRCSGQKENAGAGDSGVGEVLSDKNIQLVSMAGGCQ